MNVATLLLADDHRVVREGFRALLEAERDFRIVGEAGDGLEAVRLAEKLVPNIVVMDLTMPGLNGLEVIRQISRRSRRSRIVVLSMHSHEDYVLGALRNGAAAYVLKDSSSADLVRAVRDALAGRRYLSPSLTQPAIELYLERALREETFDLYETLSHREREVLQLGAEGHTNAKIAARLFISSRTVETHRANAMRKLGLRSQTDLIRYALQRGILPLEENLTRSKRAKTDEAA